jgi:prophage regulatory protein
MAKQHSITLPATGFVRLPAILDHIPIGKSTWWAGVKTGRFPQPVKLGGRITAWRVEDIHRLIEDLGKAAGNAP